MTNPHIAPAGAVSKNFARRGMLAGAGLAALVGAGGLALPAEHLDAGLFVLVDEHNRLEDQLELLTTGCSFEEEERLQPAVDVIAEAMAAVSVSISACRARTLDGMRAKAEAIVKLGHCTDPSRCEYANEKLHASLLRDLLGRA